MLSPEDPLINNRVILIENDVVVKAVWKTSVMPNGGPVFLHEESGEKVLYKGHDKLRAENERLGYNNRNGWLSPNARISTELISFETEIDVIITSHNDFKIINSDGTNDDFCLLFTSISAGFGGTEKINQNKTTAKILKTCNILGGGYNRIGAITLLKPGEYFFHEKSAGFSCQVESYGWNGETIAKEYYDWQFNDETMCFEQTTRDLCPA